MQTQTIVTTHPSGEIQRFQTVRGFEWQDLQFRSPTFDSRSIEEIARLYRINIVRKRPEHYGTLVFFCLTAGHHSPFGSEVDASVIHSSNVAASMGLNAMAEQGTLTYDGSFTASDPHIVTFLDQLKRHGLLSIVQGSKTGLRFCAINERMGFASAIEAALVVNTHFFLMDPTDLDSPYCELGTPYGLAIKDGVTMMPPLNGRPCFVVDYQGQSQIVDLKVEDLVIEIDGRRYSHTKGCRLYSRRSCRVTPPSRGSDIAIVEDRVVAVKDGGEMVIPMAGFVLSVDEPVTVNSSAVRYHGLEAYRFGIQVGPSMMRSHVMVDYLDCPFYDATKDPVPFPSTVYPLPFEDARAARIAIGTDEEGEAILIWAEGASKCRYVPGHCSTGASLLELARFCQEEGYENILNLDGGGSAQILVDGVRSLRISDRHDDDQEAERPVPMLLVIDS